MAIGPACDVETFAGVGMELDGSEPIVRHKPSPAGSSYESNRKMGREKLGKVWNDMQRHVILQVERAIERTVRTGGCLAELAGHPTRLKAADGPAVVVDLDETVVMWYFPGFIGGGLMVELLRTVGDLAKVYRPSSDADIKDRRAQSNGAEKEGENTTVPDGVLTRHQTAQLAAVNPGQNAEDGTPADEEEARADVQENETGDEGESETEDEVGDARDPSEGGWSSMPTWELDSGDVPTCPEPYVETDGDICWRGSEDDDAGAQRACCHKPGTAVLEEGRSEYLADLAPFAYYLSPGWFQTGMENMTPSWQQIRPMAMSKHFREALQDECSAETIALLRAQRLYNRKLGYLTGIIHSSLSESMQELRDHMSAVTGPTSVALQNGWTSAFPCVGVAVNRTCPLHRDTKGIRGAMDVIGVLGTFVHGGELGLPDVDVEVEWTPGCVGAFDGYDFRHQVKPWGDGTRVALISFCRKSTWKGLKLDSTVTRPTLPEVKARLKSAQDVRASAVLEACESRKRRQAAERQGREREKAVAKVERAKRLATERQEQQAQRVQHAAYRVQSRIGHRQWDVEYGDQEQELGAKRPKMGGSHSPVSHQH
ncbi:hypothetical protein FRC06_005159 [Ceratobasidium sp. 370]|nr:hypothetical protein FRC06_005159 [Ceratobasidium sp. 370]